MLHIHHIKPWPIISYHTRKWISNYITPKLRARYIHDFNKSAQYIQYPIYHINGLFYLSLLCYFVFYSHYIILIGECERDLVIWVVFSYVKKVKWSRYRPSVAQRVGRGIALLFHDCGTRRGWVVSSKLRPHSTPGKDPVPILQKTGWAPGPVWTGGKSRPHRDSIPDRPARSQSLYRLNYPAHF